MSVDLRTELNDADSTTGWATDGSGLGLNTTTGQRYEGTGSIEALHSNSDAALYTTSIGGTRNLSDSTVYVLSKDNLVAAQANRGLQVVLGDGTNRIGYAIGGFDAPGLGLQPFYNAYKLDVTQRSSPSFTYAGSEVSLNTSAITQVGIGTVHLAKAVGNVPNTFVDRMAFHANGAYGLRINGGTSGTPETMDDVQGDDAASGWGMIAQPYPGQFAFWAPTEFGEPSANADHYFEAVDETWVWLGYRIAATHFDFRVISNSADTGSFVLTRVNIVGVDTPAGFDMSSSTIDFLKLSACVMSNLGAISFPPRVAGDRFCNDTIFNNCGIVSLSTLDCDRLTFNGTSSLVAALSLSTANSSQYQENIIFNSGGSGHAVVITTPGSYDFTNWFFNGYGSTGTTDAAIYNNSGGAVTINVFGGDLPTYRNGAGASTTIVSSVPITVTCIDSITLNPIQNARIFLETDPGGVDIIAPATRTNASGQVVTTFGGTVPVNVTGFARKGTESPTYKTVPITGTVTSNGFEFTAVMTPDGG